MGRIKQSPKLPAATRRAQLLASARKLFVKKGYRGTTIEEIGTNAGLTKGAVYFHFKNKEDILYNLVKAISEQHETEAAKMFRPNMKPSEFFFALNGCHKSSTLDAYSEIVEIWVQAFRVPRIKRYIAGRIRQFIKLYEDCVDPVYARNRKELQNLGLMTIAMHDGLSLGRLISPSLIDFDEMTRLSAFYFDRPVKRGSGRREQ